MVVKNQLKMNIFGQNINIDNFHQISKSPFEQSFLNLLIRTA